ncbi:MAG: hypothetical protein H6719_31295 [Sandaracinaceae bacterium]|nr:hypothetical protein [Sandaracinaceae bacterium]
MTKKAATKKAATKKAATKKAATKKAATKKAATKKAATKKAATKKAATKKAATKKAATKKAATKKAATKKAQEAVPGWLRQIYEEHESEALRQASRDVAAESEAYRRRFAAHDLPIIAELLFDFLPNATSVLFGLAQFYADNADDEVHRAQWISKGARPAFPHVCTPVLPEEWDELKALRARGASERGIREANQAIATRQLERGDVCDLCAMNDRLFREAKLWERLEYNGLADEAIEALAPYCKEGCHQDMDPSEAYLPYAIATRGADGPVIQVVGEVQRPWALAANRADAAARLGLMGGGW